MTRKKIDYKDVLQDTYEISTKGNIFDLRTEKKVKIDNVDGELFVDLDRDPESKYPYPYPLKVSRLVAKHFITKKIDGKVVTFMDLNPKNVKANNLLVISEDLYNDQFSYLIKLIKGCAYDKITLFYEEDVEEICRFWESRHSVDSMLEHFGINKKTNKKDYYKARNIIFDIRSRYLYFSISKDYEWNSDPFDQIVDLIKKTNKSLSFKDICRALALDDNFINERIYINAVYKVYGKDSLKYFEFLNYRKVKVKKN